MLAAFGEVQLADPAGECLDQGKRGVPERAAREAKELVNIRAVGALGVGRKPVQPHLDKLGIGAVAGGNQGGRDDDRGHELLSSIAPPPFERMITVLIMRWKNHHNPIGHSCFFSLTLADKKHPHSRHFS